MIMLILVPSLVFSSSPSSQDHIATLPPSVPVSRDTDFADGTHDRNCYHPRCGRDTLRFDAWGFDAPPAFFRTLSSLPSAPACIIDMIDISAVSIRLVAASRGAEPRSCPLVYVLDVAGLKLSTHALQAPSG